MDVPPKGSIIRQRYELGVRWRQTGRAIAKESPLVGLVGSAAAGWPIIRDIYPSAKAVRRSDAFTHRSLRTTRLIEWTVYGLVIAYGAAITIKWVAG